MSEQVPKIWLEEVERSRDKWKESFLALEKTSLTEHYALQSQLDNALVDLAMALKLLDGVNRKDLVHRISLLHKSNDK